MKIISSLLVSVVTAVMVFTISPVLAGDSFVDLFSQTKICFSHIAINDGWETEVAVLNPTTKVVSGNLTFYTNNGTQLGEAFPLTINANGRYQVVVGETFTKRGTIEYIIFRAPVYGLKGYSKFYNATTRASIMASTPQTTGLFTKLDHDGWTGIAFVNTADIEATVILTAYSDAGEEMAVSTLQVKAGEKVVNFAQDLFVQQSISGASYIRFDSDQGIVAFFLNGSSDYSKLDGSKAL
ncbi:MAG: hypothetical protein U9Q58_09895 [Pseudomonadota bacterium]|nr:hypothetical protein [Pseudomonadota bacterium]